MKKLFVTAFAFALAFSSVQAQEITERKRERHGSEFRKLDLTEEQKTKFKAANDDYRKQMEDLKKQDQLTVKESRDRMSKLREEHKAKVQGFLTSEQKAKMEASKKDRKGKFGSKKSDRKDKGEFSRKGKGGMDRMKEDLQLTDDQAAKLKTSREATYTEMKALRADKTLSEDARKERVKELKNKQKEQLKSVLTEEQFKKFEEGKKKHSPKKQSV